jgi:hypothetical protein
MFRCPNGDLCSPGRISNRLRISQRVGKAFHNPSLTGQGRGDYVLEGGRRSPIWREQLKAGAHRAAAVLGALKLTRIGEAFAAWHGKKGCKEPCA